METQDIISSGLLELYAAGIASEKEAVDIELWITKFPEVAQELKEIMISMELYAMANGIKPAQHIKEKIFARISQGTFSSSTPVVPFTNESSTKIISSPFWKLVAAALIVLLIGSIALNILTYNRYNEANQNLYATRQSLNGLQEQNKQMEAGLNVFQSKYSVPVSLKGLEASPDAAAKIFYMQNTGEVYIDPSNLPEAPAGKQYQLWAIVNGKPVDGGMILTSKKGDKYTIQKMKTFGKVEAFAVTLEAEKGNATPKGPMYVMGKM